jgi:hypothetical protein
LELLGAVGLGSNATLSRNANYFRQEVNPYDPETLGANARIIPYKNGTMIAWVEVYGHSHNPDSSFLLP